MPASQLPHVAANLRGIARRVPQLPLTEMMICRVAVILGRDLHASLDRVLLPHGLAEPEYRVLVALYARGGSACPRDLCGALAQSPANLTRICDTLVRRGYVSRTPDASDRRRMQLTLRASGQTILVIDKYVERLIALADRHTILERGQVVWRGTSAELDADHGIWHRYLGI